jgi:Ca2+/Na+ antiporter
MESLPDRLPLVIGVTGHRDLRDEDLPRLEQEVAGIVSGLRRDYLGGDPETPIIVLSALAEGADRLVARVALREGARLIAPLPLPLEEYRRDFEPGLKSGNMAEFDALLSQAIAAPVMPLHASLEDIRADGKKRAEQYRAVGIFITQHCHVLLALWDGDDQDVAAGGTAEVVTFKRGGIPLMVSGSPRASLDASEVGPVIEIVTPRMKETTSAKEVAVRPWGRAIIDRHLGGLVRRSWHRVAAFFGHVFWRDVAEDRSKLSDADRHELEVWENFAALVDLTAKFNRDAAALERTTDGTTRLTQSIDYLFTDPAAAAADADAKGRAMQKAPLWCRLYAMADTLALERQLQFKRDWKVLFGVGFIAFGCFAMFTHAGYHWYALFLFAYLLAFVIGVFVYVRAAHRQDQERYLDYRALAEALRVAVYWKLIGVGSRYLDAKFDAPGRDHADINPVGVIANAYPIKQPSELAWVKVCLRTLERLDKPEGDLPRRIDPVGHAIARRFWVHGQYAYFRRQGYRHNTFAERMQAWSDILVVLSAFVLVPILIWLVLAKIEHHWHVMGVEIDIPLIVVGLLPGAAAVLTGYSERLALKAQARQYDRMRMLFERAYDLLPPEIDDHTTALAHTLYQELGMEAMRENAEWVAIYRQRPIEPMRG